MAYRTGYSSRPASIWSVDRTRLRSGDALVSANGHNHWHHRHRNIIGTEEASVFDMSKMLPYLVNFRGRSAAFAISLR
jgi:hypothetical protein